MNENDMNEVIVKNTKINPFLKKVLIWLFIVVILAGLILLLLPKCEICGSRKDVSDYSGMKVCLSCWNLARKSSYGYSSNSSFTNKFGTPTTICAHPGCTNHIASSGDTNCCTQHSNRCLECRKYIDEDAMYCVDCIKKAAGY